MVVLDATIVNIALPSAQRASTSPTRPPVDHHGLRARVRQPAAARRPAQRPFGPQEDLHRRPDRLRARIRGRRRGRTRRARRRPRRPGRIRGAARARALSLLDRDLHRPQGARQGVRHLRCDRRWRRRRSGCCSAACSREYLGWRWSIYVNLVFAAIAAIGRDAARDRNPRHRTAPGWTSRARVLVSRACSRSCTDSRTPRRTAGAPMTIGLLAAASSCSLHSSLVEAEPGIRCCRCACSPTATGRRLSLDRHRRRGMFAVFLFLTYYLQETRTTRRQDRASASYR